MTKRKGAELADASSAAKAAPKAARNGAGGTELDRARRFVHFLTAAVTPFHAVSLGASMLETAGFVRLEEDSPWTGVLKPGGKYYYTRCDSTLVAFAVGGGYKPGGAFKVVGAHTDSPALKAKPLTKHGSGAAESLTQVSVATYGGGLWHTWFDRDLGIGGMVLTRGADGAVSKRLVAVHEPVLRVPSLCIHLQTAEERASFAPNKESHLAPVLCVAARRQLEGAAPDAGAYAAAQEPELMRLLAERMGVGLEAIVSFDLTLFDTQPPAIGGTHSEFVLGGRLDNLASSFVALEALIDSADEVCTRAAESDVACIALFDHEEVGSSSQQGAGGPVMKEMLTRVSDALGAPTGSEPHAIGLRKSFLLSVDNAHAVHPNYRVSCSEHVRVRVPASPGASRAHGPAACFRRRADG